ncbi:MAG TPA: response regulator [Myxococcota bacterium]|nr:response regulator [Myxococcota bacterium]HRY97110.1 response regulator [Myxococcota bacterium]HSA23170.1 response regulator [Myxococcota bacterium]
MAKVLIVDDSPDLRQLIQTLVGNAGHDTRVCENAAQARAEFARERPDLMVCDVDMPGETGVAMLIKLRLDDPDFRTPVVFVTAHPERAQTIRKTAPELIEVVGKPFRKDDLLGAVRRRLAAERP